jgi:hypothetical protein
VPPAYEPLRSPHKNGASPSPRPLHPLISRSPPTLIMEVELLPVVSPLPETLEPSSSPRRRCWPGPLTATPTCTAIQDPFYHRHPLRHPQPAGPRAHRGAGREEGLHLRTAKNHPGGESPPLPDSGASALRKGQGYGGPRCPGHIARPLGGHPPVRPRIGPAPIADISTFNGGEMSNIITVDGYHSLRTAYGSMKRD